MTIPASTIPARPKLTQLWFFYPLFVVAPLALLGLFERLLVDQDRYVDLLFASLLLIAATLLLMLLALHGQRSYLWHHLHSRHKSKTKFVLSHLFLLLLLAPPGMALGIPSLLHLFGSEPAQQVVTITGKAPGYDSRRGCDGTLYIAEYRHFLNDNVCGVPQDLWAAARPGDTLLLDGERSLLGFKPLRVTLKQARAVEEVSGLPRFAE
ncbi:MULTISPECIES: hypothetical protein [unclassified Pseudomonas]|uniref:hypothetical protein n=1 Tax=unclassified Pseudomonas TaxID=196821 RepID=UPI00244B3FF0|nr:MULTISPECIES: hypothetical protein [unclassified Pseudomonas]MDG9922217.1 hypothetical protein [Pseudomonas sp. GD04045]MDH0033690.1 hypothetical protein [Pseudomonas sp. GD04019]